jgi:hypothetical protein
MQFIGFVLLATIVSACQVPPPNTAPTDGSQASPTEASSAPTEATAPRSSRTVRLVIYDRIKNSSQRAVAVNEGHPGLKTESGRMAIALGSAEQAFKVLPEALVDSMLKGLGEKGLEELSSPFESGDEPFITGLGTLPDRFRWCLYLEVDGKRSKVVCKNPSGPDDDLGRALMKRQSELRIAAWTFWDMRKQIEIPRGVSIGR